MCNTIVIEGTSNTADDIILIINFLEEKGIGYEAVVED